LYIRIDFQKRPTLVLEERAYADILEMYATQIPDP
jgi:hypothetical protein